MSKNKVFVGRRVRLDLKRVRCGQCRKKIGEHSSFLMAHVINANNPQQHGLVPLCGVCFTANTGAVGEAIEAIREVASRHVREAAATAPATKRPN